jgi:magnesium-transporting ATPase (P-type)
MAEHQEDAIVVAASVTLDFVQEHRAGKAAERLRQSVETVARVRRSGRELDVPARLLVTGDVVHLEAGDLVPADGRLLFAKDLQVTQAALTGEPFPVDKIPSEDARREIADSRRVLEDAVGTDITAIAYPFGRYDAQTESLVSEAGYRRAVTTSEALVPAEPDWLALPRVSVNRDVGPIQFRAKVTPALAVYESWRGRR